MTSLCWQEHSVTIGGGAISVCFVQLKRRENRAFMKSKRRMRKIITHPRVQDLLHPRLGKPRRRLQILDSRKGFPRPSLNAVLDSISPFRTAQHGDKILYSFHVS